MSQEFTLSKVAGDATSKPVEAAGLDLFHPVGEVITDQSTTTSTPDVQPKILQRMPKAPIGDFLTRLVELTTWNISAGNTTLQQIAVIDPWPSWLGEQSIIDKVNHFAYIRGTMELVFVPAIPGSCYGLYSVSALCMGGQHVGPAASVHLHSPNCWQVDHYGKIDCAASDNVVLQLPFIWPYDYTSTDFNVGGVDMWEVRLICLSPLRTAMASGVTSGTIRVFARLMPDYDMVVPTYQGKRKGALVPSTSTETFTPAKHKELVKKAPGKVQQVANLAASVAGKLSDVPFIGDFAKTGAKVAEGVGYLAGMFGFSRLADERPPMSVAHRSVSNVAHCEGGDSAEASSLAVTAEISVDPTIVGGSHEDCASFTSLFARWTLVKTMTWATTAAPGDSIGGIPVSPHYHKVIGLEHHQTTAGFVGMPFTYWRGDMEYLVVIPASKLHRGTLQVAWHPAVSHPSATNVTNKTYNVIFEATAGEEHQFVVGFARDKICAKCEWLWDALPIINLDETNGALSFRVINTLQAAVASASVEVHVFARAGANMQFGMPRTTMRGFDPPASPTELDFNYYSIMLQGGALGDEDTDGTQQHVLVPSSGTYPIGDVLFGEDLSSVRALMQRPSRVFYYEIVSPSTTRNIPCFGYFPLLGVAGQFNWSGYYRTLFTGIAASERYRIFPNQNCWIGVAPGNNTAGGLSNYGATVPGLAPMTYSGPQRGAEFTVPYYQRVKYLLGYEIHSETSTERKNKITIYTETQPEPATFRYIVYQSFGPDIRLTNFRQVCAASTDDTAAPEQGYLWFKP